MSVEQVLRQYEPWECTGSGYPEPWGRPVVGDEEFNVPS